MSGFNVDKPPHRQLLLELIASRHSTPHCINGLQISHEASTLCHWDAVIGSPSNEMRIDSRNHNHE